MTTKNESISSLASTVEVSVITTCYGRNRHLYNLLSSLEVGTVKPAEVIIVNDDAEPSVLKSYDLNIKQIPTVQQHAGKGLKAIGSNNNIDDKDKRIEPSSSKIGFDIGRNRNAGAQHATYENMIFLDVDCIVATDFVAGVNKQLTNYPNALLMGQPYYLTRPLNEEEGYKLRNRVNNNIWLNELAILNPYRHNLDESTTVTQTQDYGAFWSLCFAVTKTQFNHIGGFDTHYVGYGAEDTDFAFVARDLNIDLYLTNYRVYHQQHAVSRPPLNHLASIIINANRFYEKWQHWPMGGWLQEFNEMNLIDWQNAQTHEIEIIRQPSQAEIDAASCPDAPFV